MVLNWLEILLLGLISGLTEFLPVSASGHQGLMLHLLGQQHMDPLCRMLITCGTLGAVLTACSGPLRRLMLERAVGRHRGKGRSYGTRRYDYRLLNVAAVPLVISAVIYAFLDISVTLPLLVVTFIVNGIILFVPDNMRQGNKDARHMTRLDGIIIGLCGGFSGLPGISLVGTVSSVSTALGAHRQYAIDWAFLLTIPVLAVRILVDLFLVLTGGTAFGFLGILCCIGGGVLAYAGGRFGIRLVRLAAAHIGISGFSYYAWGAAMLSFILFLIT